MEGLSIIYITARKSPMFEWFAESLLRQFTGEFALEVVVVDLHHSRARSLRFHELLRQDKHHVRFTYPEVLPSFCQGYYRLTKEEYFDASIARNTGFVYTHHNYVAFVDDVSILMPGWLNAVVEGARHNRITLGAYQKHTEMEVEQGRLKYSKVDPKDIDSRWKYGRDDLPVAAYAQWFYGCSFAMPLDMALKINGFDELCAITGYEDCNFGLRLEKAYGGLLGLFSYDRAMFTVESIEHHSNDVVMKRIDPEISCEFYWALLEKYGIGARPVHPRYDASHFQLDIVKYSNTFESALNGFDLRRLREKAQKGETIGIKDMGFPDKFWFDGKALKEM